MRLSYDSPERIEKLKAIANNSPIIREIKMRVNERNENVLILTRGLPGSGKSLTCAAAAELIQPERFDMTYEAYDYDGFIKIMMRPDLKKGDVIIWDEPGEGLSADEWQSKVNGVVKKIFRLFRFLNLVVFICAPNEGWVDKKIRGLFHAEIKCKSEWKTRHAGQAFNHVKFYWLDWSDKYQKTIRRLHRDENGTTIDWVKVPLPTEPILKAYNTLMIAQKTGEIRELITKQNEPEKKKAEKKVFDVGKNVEAVLAEPTKFRGTEGKLSVPLIMAHLGLSQYRATAVKQLSDKASEHSVSSST